MSDLQNLRIVLVTGCGPQHVYMANRLAAALPLAGIIVDHGKKDAPLAKCRRILRKHTIPQIFFRAIQVSISRVLGHRARRNARIVSILGAQECTRFNHQELVTHVNGINTPEGVRRVASHQPDLILVFGTGVVGSKVLSLARRIALNLHTGISPYYRGSDCAFWPIHNDELHMLGATVHECTSRLDGGKIFGTTRAQLEPMDCLDSAFARCVKAGADLYVQKVAEFLAGSATGVPQDLNLGREYKSWNRNLRAEWITRYKVKMGAIRRHSQPALDQASAQTS
jgi:methionyl-tRNA formyltransferase